MTHPELEDKVMNEGVSWKDNAGYWSDCERLASIARYLAEQAPDLQTDFYNMLLVADAPKDEPRD